jgi:hypothetical protein
VLLPAHVAQADVQPAQQARVLPERDDLPADHQRGQRDRAEYQRVDVRRAVHQRVDDHQVEHAECDVGHRAVRPNPAPRDRAAAVEGAPLPLGSQHEADAAQRQGEWSRLHAVRG